MKIPATATPDVQDAFREVWAALDRLQGLQTDFKGVKLQNVGTPTGPFDAATKDYVDSRLKGGS